MYVYEGEEQYEDGKFTPRTRLIVRLADMWLFSILLYCGA
jgi:hypothetical protein